MKDDTVQLAAYALIIIVIGLSSVIKKVLEARRKRRILEAQEQKQHKTVVVQDSRGLRSEDETTSPSEPKEITGENVGPLPVPQPMAETEEYRVPPKRDPDDIGKWDPDKSGPEVTDLEKVLRRALGLPDAEDNAQKERERKLAELRQQQIKIRLVTKQEKITAPEQPKTTEPEVLSGYEGGTHQQVHSFEEGFASGWSDFIHDLNTDQPSELVRAIILSEVIAPPIALRRHRNLRIRLI
jgi:hypothetical protein